MGLINYDCLTPTPTPPDCNKMEKGQKTPTLSNDDKPEFYQLADISNSKLYKRRQRQKDINSKKI